MGKPIKYAPEVRERAVRLVREHEREYPSQVGGDQLDCRVDRVYGGDAAWVGAASGA